MKSATECDLARPVLLDRLGDDTVNSLVGLALDGCIDVDDTELARAVEHVRSCESCRSWRETELQPELFAWRRRASQYCCGEMFRAVAGPERFVSLQASGPEMLQCWTFGAEGPVIRFCPWCGTPLPTGSP